MSLDMFFEVSFASHMLRLILCTCNFAEPMTIPSELLSYQTNADLSFITWTFPSEVSTFCITY